MPTISPSNNLSDLLKKCIANHLFTGAQLVVQQDANTLVQLAEGSTKNFSTKTACAYCPVVSITHDTLFDVASLTKPLVTTSLVMHAVEHKKLSISQKIVRLLPDNLPYWLLECTIADLLTHSTPLQAWIDLHSTQSEATDHENATKNVIRQIALSEPRTNTNQCCYSDLGFIILGYIIELLYHEPLDVLFRHLIAKPLGLEQSLTYYPLHHVDQKNCAATHFFLENPLQGHPDDDNVRAMNHVAGHAGLFASASAIAAFCAALQNGQFPISKSTISLFVNYIAPHSTYALGWDRPTSTSSLSSRLPGEHVIGHLGYTGCSVWIDLDTQRSVTLLTNRSHVNNEPASIAEARREIHNLAWNI